MSNTNPTPPDQNYGKNALTDEMLPEGSSAQGMSGNVNPDDASQETGYFVIGEDTVNRPEIMPRDGDDDAYPDMEAPGGFAKRPAGWER